MSYFSIRDMAPSLRELSRKASIVGIGESDFHDDYQAERKRPEGWEPPTIEGLMTRALDRALDDAGLTRDDIDGLAASFTFGGPPPEEVARVLGLKPKYAIANGNIMAGPLPNVCAAIAEGKADTVVMVFAVASRSAGRQFGGMDETTGGSGDPTGEGGAPASYYYFHPWGWSSQAAHWAMMWSHYQWKYGKREEDLGEVAMQLRRHAMARPNAVMQKPMSIEDYMASRYIVRPLHLFDICMVNDGAVCLIVRRADMARGMKQVPVDVAGWSESRIKKDKMRTMVCDLMKEQIVQARDEAFAMAGVTLDDIGHFEGYDASSFHLANQVEKFGFVPVGTVLDAWKDGQMTVGGRIPTNTGGGNLSYSYMQGWSHVVEVVRQLRHQAGQYQVPGVRTSVSCLAQTDEVHPIVYVRGEQ